MKKIIVGLVLVVFLCGCQKKEIIETGTEETVSVVEDKIAHMTLRQKVGQLFIVRPDALDFSIPQEQINDAKA